MKIFLLVITFLSIGISYAQEEEKNTVFIEEGRWGLGGRFSINSNNNEYGPELNNRSENFNIYAEPKVVYSLGNNWLVGLSIGYNYYKQENSFPSSSDQESVTHVLGLAPNIQKYFPVFDLFAFFLQASLE